MPHGTTDDKSDTKIDSLADLAYLSRRGLLRTGATALPFSMAGCLGGDGETAPDIDDDDELEIDEELAEDPDYEPVEERIDTRFVTEMKGGMPPIPNTSFNVYDPTNYITCCEAPGPHYWASFQLYYDYLDEEHMILGESWEMADETTVRQTFRDDVYWWDGTPVTTDDIAVIERIDDAIWEIQSPDQEQPYVEGWEIVDERTWELHLTEPFDETFVQSSLIQDSVNVKADLYGPYADEMEDLLADDDVDGAESALVDLMDARFGWDDQYGNGPLKYQDHDDTRWILEVNEDWPYADTILFTEWMWQEFEDEPEAFINLNTSAIHAWQPSEDEMRRAEDNIDLLVPARQDNALSMGYHINVALWDYDEVTAPSGIYDPITREPEGWLVRKALMYAMDNEMNARALDGQWDVVDSPIAGMPYTQVDPPDETDDELVEWMWENLENYAPHDPDKAIELMEEAGLTYDEEEDTWYDWDDEEIEVIIRSGAEPTQVLALEHNLEEIGLNVNLIASEGFGTERHEGEFEIVPDNGSGTDSTSIYGSFPIGDWYAQKYNGPSGERAGREWMVPPEMGNYDVTDPDEREGWVMLDRWNEFLLTGDDDILKELFWMRNQYVVTVDYGIEVQEGHFNGDWWYVEGPRGLRHEYQPFLALLQAEEGIIAPRRDADVHPGHFQ